MLHEKLLHLLDEILYFCCRMERMADGFPVPLFFNQPRQLKGWS